MSLCLIHHLRQALDIINVHKSRLVGLEGLAGVVSILGQDVTHVAHALVKLLVDPTPSLHVGVDELTHHRQQVV